MIDVCVCVYHVYAFVHRRSVGGIGFAQHAKLLTGMGPNYTAFTNSSQKLSF